MATLKLVSERFPDVELDCYGYDVVRKSYPYGFDNSEITAKVRYVPAYMRETPGIRKVIYNDPATVVLWNDGTKTVVKCMEGDAYSEEMGLAMCICKKVLGDNYHRVFREWATYKPEPKSKYKVGDRVRFWVGDKSTIGVIVRDDGSGRMQYLVKEEENKIFYCYESRKESLNDVWYIEGLADE